MFCLFFNRQILMKIYSTQPSRLFSRYHSNLTYKYSFTVKQRNFADDVVVD